MREGEKGWAVRGRGGRPKTAGGKWGMSEEKEGDENGKEEGMGVTSNRKEIMLVCGKGPVVRLME